MRSLWVGSLAAAVVMFALGFVFFGLLFPMALSPLAPDAASAVQSALGTYLPASGTYMAPAEEEAWMAGPGALVQFTAAGGAPSMAMAMIGGFVHMAVTAFLIGLGLRAVGGDFARRSHAVLWFGLAAALFMHLGDPIWFGHGWRMALFVFVADGLMFIAGGLVLARWFTGRDTSPTYSAAE
jgi:hypothetical protein